MNIRERREQLGISQKDLADKAGIKQATLCDIEHGRCKPSLDVAVRIAKVIDVESIHFFSDM